MRALRHRHHELEQPAACPAPKGSACAYFFKRDKYLRYNLATDAIDVPATDISRNWPALPADFHRDIDATLNWGNGHVYFFKGSHYLRYNIGLDQVDVPRTEIRANWRKLPAEFHGGIKATLNWGNGKAYFFKADRYLRYDIASDVVDVGPTEISRYWTKLPKEFHSGLHAAVNWGNGKAYFFKGRQYLRYDIAADLVDVGPTDISRYWPALPADFQADIGAAVNWTYPVDLAAFLENSGIAVTTQNGWRTRGAGACFTPIGIIMHHSAGTGANALADIVRLNKANFWVDRGGTLSVVAAGRANHAGQGSPVVLAETNRGIAPTGTAAQRRLPSLRTDPIGNGHFYGFENENDGVGQDWPEEQLDTMARAAAALCQLHAWRETRVISHAEWTARKVDPHGIDMNDFRRRVASFL